MSTESEIIYEIINKSERGTLSEEDREILNSWLINPANKFAFEHYSKLTFTVKSLESEKYRDETFDTIKEKISTHRRSKNRILVIFSVAASLLILLGLSMFFYRLGKSNVNAQFVEIMVPKGVKTNLTLPDGTFVYLNSNSRLRYPLQFKGRSRNVELTGEGFFRVIKNPSHPFIIKTPKLEVKVLGTEFNLKSYANESKIEVTLQKGLLRLSTIACKTRYEIELRPGYKATFNSASNKFSVDSVNSKLSSAWVTGKYFFKSKSFEEIARTLERGFNVNIVIEGEKLNNEVFTGDFVRGENLEQILKIIRQNTAIDYEINGQEIFIKEKE